MKSTAINARDRMAAIFGKAQTIVGNLPLDKWQENIMKALTDKLNDDLLDQIEMLTMKLKDQEEAFLDLRALHDNLYLRNQELQAKLEAAYIHDGKLTSTQVERNNAEKEIIGLKEELKIQCKNRDHFRALVAEQDAFIKELKKQFEVYKAKKQFEVDEAKVRGQAELQTKTKEAEHLASQAIRLNEENSALIKKNTELEARNNQLNDQTPRLIEENNKFREQTTRLIEEKRNLQGQICCNTQPPCGGCFSCLEAQANYSISELDTALCSARTELKVYKNVSDLRKNIIDILYPLVFDLTNNWFPPKGLHQALTVYYENTNEIELELDALKPATSPKNVILFAGTSTVPKKTCCEPTHACCGDVHNVI
jgi:chromosome segregation ATPase